MKAIQIACFGGPETLTIVEVAMPTPGPGQVLIRVEAAGVNFAETLMREDAYIASYTLPAIPGSEIAGVIAALGPGVDGWRVGQRVAAVLAAARVLTGGYADYVVADTAVIAQLPDDLDPIRAVAVLVQGLTALNLARIAAPRTARILVTAAGGGVASLLIQLLRHAGADRIVAAASSAAKRDHALSMGADTAVSYGEIDRDAYDLIYDSVGDEVFGVCLAALAREGVLVAYGALNLRNVKFDAHELFQLMNGNRTLRGFTLSAALREGSLTTDLPILFDLVTSGRLTVKLGAILPLQQAKEAHSLLARRASVGKLVLVP